MMSRFTRSLVLLPLLGVLMHAKENLPQVPDYSQVERSRVPDSFKWRISDLFSDESAWRAEFAQVKELAESLDGLAKGWTDSPQGMADLLERASEVERRGDRLYAYTSLQSDMDMGDAHFQTMKGEVRHFFVDLAAKLAFLDPDVLKLGREKVEAFLKAEPRLAPFRFNLEKILRAEKHTLSEAEERVAAMTGLFSDAPSRTSGLLTNLDIPRPEIQLSDGTKVLLNTANYQKYRASALVEDRRKTMEAYWTGQKQFENTLAALLDAGAKQHLFSARIHRHESCLDAALFSDDVAPEVYRNLISTVKGHLAPLHRLFRLRQKMLGLPELRYGDLYASAVASVEKTYSFGEARLLVQDAMRPLGDSYGRVLGQSFEDGWIDIYPNKGKQSGAYSSGVYGVHPYVKMNYDGTYSDVSTLAHELGHAMHSHFSNATQPYTLSQYPIFLAEIASTFNENMLMHHLLKTEKDDRLKLHLLDKYVEQIRLTLYRQTLFAEFELAMHARVEQGQSLTPDWLDQTYLELTRTYYGHDAGVVKVEDYIQSEWSGIPHFYYDFYVFQYATGIVASMALSDMVLKGGALERERYLNFLKAGGTQFPLATLKAAGVDLTSPAPVEAALQAFDGLVAEMERIQNRLEKSKKP